LSEMSLEKAWIRMDRAELILIPSIRDIVVFAKIITRKKMKREEKRKKKKKRNKTKDKERKEKKRNK